MYGPLGGQLLKIEEWNPVYLVIYVEKYKTPSDWAHRLVGENMFLY